MDKTTIPTGPWIVEPINGGQSYQVTTAESTGFRVIAETDDERVAKALTAFPDLVEALEVIGAPDEVDLVSVSDSVIRGMLYAVINMAKNASAKARGDA